MPDRYKETLDLYRQTLQKLTQNPAQWRDFLQSAGHNYKLPFSEQLLVYAQRPNATAVLEYEKWNKRFGRYVKYGSVGIAVFDNSAKDGHLRYYYDISDTLPGKERKWEPVWEIAEEDRLTVLNRLAAAAGYAGNTSEYQSAILTAQALSNSQLDECLPDVLENRQNSRLAKASESA